MTSSNHDDPADRQSARPLDARVEPARRARAALRSAAFWIAVVLPFVTLAVLLTPAGTPHEEWLFGALVATNVVALYVGHPHDG